LKEGRQRESDYREKGPPALDLVEQGVHLLRQNMGALAWYYLGSLPFAMVLLFFWAEMSRSAFAEGKLAGRALLVAGVYLWMKFWHSVFARQLHSKVLGVAPQPLTLGHAARLFVAQAIIQPTALFLLPFSLIAILPFGWVSALYQTTSVLGESESGRVRPLIRAAWSQAMLWPKQNHILLLVFFGFALAVFLNWSTVAFTLPGLAKMFLGYESVFTRGGMAMLNTTFFMAVACLTFLTVDPIRKAAYVLRCFYAQSLSSGADIKAELQLLSARSAASVLTKAAVCVLLAISTLPALAANSSPGRLGETTLPNGETTLPDSGKPQGYSVNPAELDAAIQDVVNQPRFAWRLPREKGAETEKGIIGRFLDRVGETLENWARKFFHWLDEWMKRLFRRSGGAGTAGTGWVSYLEVIVYVIAGLIVIGLALLIMRMLRRRKGREEVVSQPLQEAPDISDENVRADELPEDGWLRMAKELLERGEFRLAMRAFYLASLAHLAGRGLITIARFKSNLDYDRELRRRAHALPGLSELFETNVAAFERVWYGNHPVDAGQVNDFAASVRQITEAQTA